MRMNVIIYLIFVGSLPLLHSRYYKSTNILALVLSLPLSHPLASSSSSFPSFPSPRAVFHRRSFATFKVRVQHYFGCKRYTMPCFTDGVEVYLRNTRDHRNGIEAAASRCSHQEARHEWYFGIYYYQNIVEFGMICNLSY